jgi:hypothetical protein
VSDKELYREKERERVTDELRRFSVMLWPGYHESEEDRE